MLAFVSSMYSNWIPGEIINKNIERILKNRTPTTSNEIFRNDYKLLLGKLGLIELIVIPREFFEEIRRYFNSDKEVGGYALAERRRNVLRIVGLKLNYCDENEASVDIIPEIFYELARKNPRKYEIISVHMHSRKFGEVIREYDPYWTIGKKMGRKLGCEPGKMISAEFYVSKRHELGDSDVLRILYEKSRELGINIDKTIFVHPEPGSEGEIMTPEKIEITCYRYNPKRKFNVEEVQIAVE